MAGSTYPYYAKAGLLMEKLAAKIGVTALGEALDSRLLSRLNAMTEAEALSRLAAALSRQGVSAGWEGWVHEGSYQNSPFGTAHE